MTLSTYTRTDWRIVDGYLVSSYSVPLPFNVFDDVKAMLEEGKEGWLKYRTPTQRIRCTYYDHNFSIEVGGPGWIVRKAKIRIMDERIVLVPHEETELVLHRLREGVGPEAMCVKGVDE